MAKRPLDNIFGTPSDAGNDNSTPLPSTSSKPLENIFGDVSKRNQPAPKPQQFIETAQPDNRPLNTIWSRIGQTILPDFLQKELNIAPEQRKNAPVTPGQQESISGNLITTREMAANPSAVSPLEYLRRGLTFGHNIDPTNTLAGYQKDVTVEDLPEPVTIQQQIAEGIGTVLTMSIAQPLIESALGSIIGGIATKIPAVGKAADAISTAEKLRPFSVGYPLAITKSALTGGLFGAITKNKDSLAENVVRTAGEFAGFTALAYPIQAFFKPIIEQVGKATIDNPTAQKVLGNKELTSKPIASTMWFRNPTDPSQILKVTANGVTFTKEGGTDITAGALKDAPTFTSLNVEAFKENPSLYQSLKEWVAGKIPKKTNIEFATKEQFDNAAPVETKAASKASDIRTQVVKTEAEYAKNPTPEVEAKLVAQRGALIDYQQTYAQPSVETPNIKVQVLPYDDGKWDFSVNAKSGQDAFSVPFGNGELYPSKEAATKAGLAEVTTWAKEKEYTDLVTEAKTAPESSVSDTPPASSKMGFSEPQTIEDVQSYLKDGTARYGSKEAFLNSDEYHAYHDTYAEKLSSIFAENKAIDTKETEAIAEKLGVKVGDVVEYKTKGGDTIQGVVKKVAGRYLVQFDSAVGLEENGQVSTKNRVPLDERFTKSAKQPTQEERVATAVADKAKSIKEVSQETGIVEPNIRRILGVGAKDGTFSRVEKGVYILTKDGQDIAYVHTGDAIETLPKLAKEGVKVDMVFLDIPYDTPAVKGGNRGAKYELISVADFGKVLDALKKMTAPDAPVVQMYSQANSGMEKMQKYNDLFIEKGWKAVGKGEYSKTYADGSPVGFPTRAGFTETKPEGILVFTQSGKLKKDLGNLNFKLVRPKGYQTEKPAIMLQDIIKMTTNEGETILDPFAGSGVSGAEAIKAGRKAILIEKNADVVDKVIKPRLGEATRQVKNNSSEKDFFALVMQKGNRPEFVSHKGKPIDLGIKGDYFLHRTIDTKDGKTVVGDGWTVSDGESGMTLVSSKPTQKAAIEAAKTKVEEVGNEGMKIARTRAKESYGVPPKIKNEPKPRLGDATRAKKVKEVVSEIGELTGKTFEQDGLHFTVGTINTLDGQDVHDYFATAEETNRVYAFSPSEIKSAMKVEKPSMKKTGTSLPKELQGAKPRYGYQDKQFELEFQNDVDKALYIVAQKTPSKRDGDYMLFLSNVFPHYTDARIRSMGADVRAAIKTEAKDAAPGTLAVADQGIEQANVKRAPSTPGFASTGKTNIGNFEPVTDVNGASYNLKLHEEVQGLIKDFADRVGEGYLPRGAEGVFYPKEGSIRVSGMNDLSTAAHEIAHFIDAKFDITKRITTPTGFRDVEGLGIMPIYDKAEYWLRKQISNVYTSYYPTARANHPLKKKMVEGFATFVQKYMEMPKTMTEKYPKLVDAFFTPGGKYYVQDITDLTNRARKIIEDYQSLDPLDKIGARVTHDTQSVEKTPFLGIADKIRTEVVDDLFPLEKLATKAGINMTGEDPSLWARAYNNASAVVLNNMNSDKGYWSYRGGKFVKIHDYNWKTLIKQLEGEKNGDAFNFWLVARDQYFNYQDLKALKEKYENLDAQLLAQERGEAVPDLTLPVTREMVKEAGNAYRELKGILEKNGFTEKEVTDAYELAKERFSQEGEMYDALVREDLNFLNDQAVQLVDNETFIKLTSKEGYASLKRDFYDEVAGEAEDSVAPRGKGGMKASSLKQRTGSSRAILPPLDSAIRNHAEMTKKGLKQIVFNKIGDIGISAMFPDLFHVTELKAIPDDTGRILYPQDRDPDIIMARRGYKRVPILTDRLIKRTVDEVLTYQNVSYFEQLIIGANRAFTKGTTGVFAPFAISNYTIDQITATAQSTEQYVPILTPIKTLMKILGDTEKDEAAKYFTEYLVLGGERQTMVGWQDMTPRQLERRIRGEADGLQKVIEYLNQGLDILALPSKWSEIATRATEYTQSRLHGDEAIVALEKAGRVSAPFHHTGRLGGGRFAKTFLKSIPFFNPALQVLDQSIRSGIESKTGRARYWFVTAAVIASMIASLYVIQKTATETQKDLYKDLDPQMLVKYVFVPSPDGKTLIRIRVPDQMGIVGAVMNMGLADMTMNTRYDVGDYFDAATAWLPQQFQVNKPAEAILSWIPQLLKPAIEVAGNIKDFPKVMPLESQTQADKPAGLRFTEGTSPVAKWLGKQFNISPIKIDYLLTGYFGRATGYLTAKPGIYNPASVVTQDYYFSSGRRVQDFYDLKQKNDEDYNAYSHKLMPMKLGQATKILQQREWISATADLLKQYGTIDLEKDPQVAAQLRTRILANIENVEKYK